MTTPIIIAAAACLILFGIILLLVVLGGQPSKKNGTKSRPLSQSRPTTNTSRPRSQPVRKRGIGDRLSPSTTEYSAKRDLTDVQDPGQSDIDVASSETEKGEPWTMPTFPMLDTSLEPKPESGSPPATALPDTPPTPDPAGLAEEPAAPNDDPKTGTEEKPPKPEVVTPEMEPQARPEDLAALAAAMKTARTAAANGALSTAVDHLKKVASVPKSPEHQAKYDRLSLLIQYADSFRSALRDSIAALEAGDEIEVGTNGAVGVVGKTATSVTVRVKGANRKYSIDTLPPGLAIAIADTRLSKEDAVSLVMKGAYLATLKDADAQQLTKARQWFREASSKDQDTADLEKVLDDTYDY